MISKNVILKITNKYTFFIDITRSVYLVSNEQCIYMKLPIVEIKVALKASSENLKKDLPRYTTLLSKHRDQFKLFSNKIC